MSDELKELLVVDEPRHEMVQDTFAEYARFPAINNSSIKLFDTSRGGAPAKAYSYITGAIDGRAKEEADEVEEVDEEDIQEVSEALKFGTLYHTYILERDKFAESVAILDKEKEDQLFKLALAQKSRAKKFSKALKIYKDWKAQHEREGRTVVDRYTMKKLQDMAAAIEANEDVAPVFAYEYRSEVSAYFGIAMGDDKWLQCKARIDMLPLEGYTVFDLKSARSASHEKFSYAAVDFGYDLQAAFYLRALNAHDCNVGDYSFIVQEKDAPYLCARFDMPRDWLGFADHEIDSILTRMKTCIRGGKWPGYRSGELIPPSFYQSIIDQCG